MKLKLLLFLTVAVLGFGFMRPIQEQEIAWAQDEYCAELVNYPVEVTWGYSGSDTEYCPADAWTGAGWLSCGSYFSYLYDYYVRLNITFTIPAGAQHVSYASATWSGVASGGTWQVGYVSHNLSIPYGNSAEATRVAINGLQYPNQRKSISLRLEQRNLTESEANAGFLVDSFYVCWVGGEPFEPPPPKYYQPLSEIVVQQPTVDGISVSSTLPGAPVHAAADGIITSINPVLNDCINIDMLPCQDDAVQLATANAYFVHLSTDNVNFIYLVANAQDYIRPGLEITGSCIIGETLAGNTREGHTSVGLTLVSPELSEVVLELSPLPESQPCISITQPSHQTCIQGSILGDDWQTVGAHEWIGDSVRLSPGASIRQISALTGELPTQLIFSASKTSDADGSVTVTIGSGSYTFTLTTLPDQYQTPSAIHKSNASGFHELKITNTSDQTIIIHSTCVQIKIERLYPDECYFTNYDFRQGGMGWYLSSAVVAEVGQVKTPVTQEGSISQPVEIFAGDEGYNYTLDVKVTLWFYPEYEADRNSTDTVQLSYSWYGQGTPNVIDTQTFGMFGDGDEIVTFSKLFMIEDDIDDALQIQVDIDTTDPDVRGAAIREVCLSPEDDIWVGYEDTQLSDKKVFAEICRANPTPSGLNIGRWFEWLWNGILNLFSCDFAKALNGFWRLFQWFQLLVVEGVNWLGNTLLPWLGGHFFNLNFVQDILRTIQPVFDVFEMIIDAGVSIFSKIVGLVSNIVGLVTGFFDAWNTTEPIPPPFLPNCNINPQLQNTCIIFWAFEVTILDGELGQLIIPLMIATVGVMASIYFVKRFLKLFERSASNV